MRKSLKQPRVLLAFAGVLVLLITIAFGAANVRPTEATWQDTVHGESVFAADPTAFTNYARAVSGFGSIDRQATSATTQQARAFANPRNSGGTVQLNHNDSGVIDALPLEIKGSSCARVRAQGTSDCAAAGTNLAAGTSVASSEVTRMRLWLAGNRSREIITYGTSDSQKAITATAKCEPGRTGQANVSAGGPIFLREDTPLYLPPLNRQTTAYKPATLLTGVTGVLQYHHSSGIGWAKAEARLYVTSNVFLSDFTLHVTLASAECDLAGDAHGEPKRPTTARPAALQESPNQPSVKSLVNPASLRAIPEMAENKPAEAPDVSANQDAPAIDEVDSGADLPSLDDVARDESVHESDEDSGAAATTSATAAPTTSAPARPGAGTLATTTANSSTPPTSAPASDAASAPITVPTGDATTEQTSATEGPQEPETVRVGREFAVVNRDGVELGTAKVENIVRTPGCGVELTLSIATSAEAGPERWASIGPNDFAEMRPGGATRDARTISSECEQSANSETTVLSADRDYEITIAFLIDDSAQRAMLRPDGTAGWVFDLPPLPKVTATTSPSAPATTTSPTPDASAPTVESPVPTAEA
jgi:hypothetical protein